MQNTQKPHSAGFRKGRRLVCTLHWSLICHTRWCERRSRRARHCARNQGPKAGVKFESGAMQTGENQTFSRRASRPPGLAHTLRWVLNTRRRGCVALCHSLRPMRPPQEIFRPFLLGICGWDSNHDAPVQPSGDKTASTGSFYSYTIFGVAWKVKNPGNSFGGSAVIFPFLEVWSDGSHEVTQISHFWACSKTLHCSV